MRRDSSSLRSNFFARLKVNSNITVSCLYTSPSEPSRSLGETVPWIRPARFLFVGKEIHGFLEPSFRPQKVCFSLYLKLPIILSVRFFFLSATLCENNKHVARLTPRMELCIETRFPPSFLLLLLLLPVAFSSSFISLRDIITRCDLLNKRFSYTLLSFYFLYNGISKVFNHRKMESWELSYFPGQDKVIIFYLFVLSFLYIGLKLHDENMFKALLFDSLILLK